MKSYFAIFTFIFFAGLPCHAEGKLSLKVTSCAAVLQSISSDHSLEEVSRVNSKETLTALGDFQDRLLSQSEAASDFREVSADSAEADLNAKELVAGRITGIRAQFEDVLLGDQDAIKTSKVVSVLGTTISGEENILRYLSEVDSFEKALAPDKTYLACPFIILFIAAAFDYDMVKASAHAFTTGNAYDFVKAGIAIALANLYLPMNYPFRLWRTFNVRENENRDAIMALLNDKNQFRRWHFDSYNTHLSAKAVNDSLQHAPMLQRTLEINSFYEWLPARWGDVFRVVFNTLYRIAGDRSNRYAVDALVDRLLTFDPVTGEAKLMIVVRSGAHAQFPGGGISQKLRKQLEALQPNPGQGEHPVTH